MSAVKIILKRSSVLGKRPTSQLIEAGELALNTNVDDPGIFFEVSNGNIVKSGPTSYLATPPTPTPSKGELWVDSDTSKLSIGTGQQEWKSVATPFLGGSNGFSVFVAPNYEQATDAIDNDGQTIPFQTLNRAIIEVGRKVVRDALQGLQNLNLYTIYILNGLQTVANGPGKDSISTFTVDYSPGSNRTPVTQATLQQFNHPEGGLVVPRGISIIGLDLKKCELRPTYIPKYLYPGFPLDYQQSRNGPFYNINEPLSAVFRWSGDSYLNNFSVRDKIAERYITSVTTDTFGKAIFRTTLPHGLQYNDFVQTQTVNAPSNNPNFTDGQFYADPIDVFTFYLSRSNLVGGSTLPAGDYVQVSDFNPAALTLTNLNLYNVLNIYPYFAPLTASGVPLESYEFGNYSAHRSSLVKNISSKELDLFYTKIQKAFPDEFGSQLNTSLATAQETVIVAPTYAEYTTNLDSDSNLASNNTLFSSPYLNQVNHRSNYGMANCDIDGDVVSGFKSVIVNSCTAVILQKDPVAYELYNTTSQNWTTLTQYVANRDSLVITNVRRDPQLRLLNATSLLDIRYYYQTLGVNPLLPVSTDNLSTGLTDINNDFRHFGFRVRGSNAYMQAQAAYTIGAAVGVWAKDGSIVSLTNSTTNFGSVAFQAEGFSGIGTLSGANQVNKGFLQVGVVKPLSLVTSQVTSDNQKRILSLGSRVDFVTVDPTDLTIQRVYLKSNFDPSTILPYSLAPGTALYVADALTEYRGFFATDGGPTVILEDPDRPSRSYFRIRASDSAIPYRTNTSPLLFQVPFIRRYVDPRLPQDKAYGFYVSSTNSISLAPQPGSVLRLDQNSQTLSNTLNRNFQFDPGQYGGIAQVFTVDTVLTGSELGSANYNNKISDPGQSTSYGIYASLTDSGVPWIQGVNIAPFGVSPFNNPNGSYSTFKNKNYYSSENNLWSALYYETSSEFNFENGPQKVSPNNFNSTFVPTSVTLKNEPVAISWQGVVPDSFYPFYAQVPGSTFFRGATLPYNEIYNQSVIDIDDSTTGFGIIYTNLPNLLPDASTSTTILSTVVQTAISPTLWPPIEVPTTPSFGRPAISLFTVVSTARLVNPTLSLSVVELSNADRTIIEFVRVVAVNGNTFQGIRNYYPLYTVGAPPAQWPANTKVSVCSSSVIPQPSEYDPDWGVTKATMYRFYNLMGFSFDTMKPLLTPAFSGERILLNSSIPGAPVNGYAALKASWPIEFNNPSTIIANTHTWQYAGYLDYSRGLPKYQTNQFPRKLQYDFLSTTVWGGRVNVTGANNNGELVVLGPIREALTGNYYLNNTPDLNFYNRTAYASNTSYNLVSFDDISVLFDGTERTFPLLVEGQPISIQPESLLVTIGGVPQLPLESYTVGNGTIIFTEAPLANASADIRAVQPA